MTGSRGPRSSLPHLERIVRAQFADGGAVTRSDVVARTGLSRAVVAGVMTELHERGELIVAPGPASARGPGRPAAAYRLALLDPPVAVLPLERRRPVAVHVVGHDHAVAATVTGTPWTAGWDEVAPVLRSALAHAEQAAGRPVRHCVLSAPFPVRDGHGAPPLHPDLTDRPPALQIPEWLRTDPRPALSALLDRDVLLVNDANLAALGEAHFGAARGRRHVLHVTVRDGVGAGLVVDGRLVTGANGMTGELAHVQVTADGPYCLCGNRGCLATVAVRPLVAEVLTARFDRPMTFADVEALVAGGDPVSVRLFQDLGRTIARPLATVVTVLDPDVVVVDALLGVTAGPLIDGLTRELQQRCTPTLAAGIEIVRGELAEPVALGALAASNAALTDAP